MKKNLISLTLTSVFCVIIWMLFAVADMPLGPRDTAFVVAVCILVVYGIRALWSMLRKKDARETSIWIAVLMACGWLGLATPVHAQSMPEHSNVGETVVACSPSQPVAQAGNALTLTAWTFSGSVKEPEYTWTVDAGRIEGTGREVRWLLAQVRPGIHTAQVQIAVEGSAVRSCSTRLIVVAGDIDLRGGHRASARGWLQADHAEDKRYGLRSYILFSMPPSANEEQRERYLRVIEEYLRFPSAERLEKYYLNSGLRLDALNIVYLPLKSAPAQDKMEDLESPGSYRAAAEELLRRYDYERAREILSGLKGEYHRGPYIVSFPAPTNPFDQPYIFQDQSWVPPELVALWMREFQNQAAQERDWSKARSASFVLKMRTIITLGGKGLEIVQKEVNRLIAYYEGDR